LLSRAAPLRQRVTVDRSTPSSVAGRRIGGKAEQMAMLHLIADTDYQ
jgi:hypothetical protein